MIYIEKEGLPSSVEKSIIEIRKSGEWKAIKKDDTDAIRDVFDNVFPKNEVKLYYFTKKYDSLVKRGL